MPLDEGVLLGDGSNRYIDGVDFKEKVDQHFIQPNYSGKNSSQDFIIPLVQKLVEEGKQVIVFRETKGETRGCAGYLAKALNLPPAQSTLDRLPKTDQSLASDHLQNALQGGVCFHNADLDRSERQIIEEDFRKPDSKIRVIAATTTLAMGVNTPAAAVIVAGLMHPGNNPYSVAEYKNLVGRAGRLGFAEKGFSYLIASTGTDEHNYWNQYILGKPEDLQSRFLDSSTDTRSLIVKVIAASKQFSKEGMSLIEVADFLEASFGCYQMEHHNPGWQWDRSELERAFGELVDHNLLVTSDGEKFKLTKLGLVAGEAGIEVASVISLVGCLRLPSLEKITDPTLIAAIQLTRELNDLHFPINKRSKFKELETWLGELHRQSVAPEVIHQLSSATSEEYEEALRAKKAAACLLYVSGREMNELEDILTQHGGKFNGAAGPIRSVSARTCDMLAPAARVAELLHEGLDLHERVEKLAVRLSFGVSSDAANLARHTGTSLNRGDYYRLSEAELCDVKSLEEASDAQILACVDADNERLESIRNATNEMRLFESDKGKSPPFLEPYKM